ncbi:MAG: hypothetical protein K9M98_13275 [Cephaloticoccus sp.]|nr:hypothetical protein [Cephaloticoccus sp.]
MFCRILFCLLCLGGVGTISANPLEGSWRLDPAHSTDLSGWKAYDLDITIQGDVVTLTRKFAAGRRTFVVVTPVDLSKAVNVVPVSWWPDNRHIGAYIGGDKTERVRGEWLDDGRVLRLNTDLVLATQQGSRPVNILRNFTISTNGRQLTLIELRSTRTRPIVYTFQRISDANRRATGTAE